MRNISTYQYCRDTDMKAIPAEAFSDPNEYRHHIEYFVKCLIAEAGVHFSVKKDRRANKLALHASFPGAYLLDTLINPFVVNKNLKYQTESNPYVKIALQNIELFELEQLPLLINYLSDVELKRWADELNNCVAKIRYDAKNPDFEAKLTDIQKRESANFADLIDHIKSTYQRRSSFALMTTSFMSHDYHPDIPAFSNAPHLTYRDVRDIIESAIKFFHNASWSAAYIDCAWKINYFYRDRYSFDFLVLLHETKIPGDGVIEESLADYWREQTGGIGRFSGSSRRGNVVTPTGEDIWRYACVVSVVKGMTSLTHSVLQMVGKTEITQGFDRRVPTS